MTSDSARSKQDWTGRRFEAEVGAVAHGGHCVSRVDGRVVFVRHALPGELVLAEVTEDAGGSFCRADAVEVLRASPDRVEPPCPVAGPGLCGGCDWQHATHAAQLALKASVVAEQLRRLAGVERAVEVEPLPGGPLAWRTRARLVAGGDGRPGFRAHRSHRVIPVSGCPITVPGAVDGVVTRKWPPRAEIDVTMDGDGRVHLRQTSTVRGRPQAKQLKGGQAVEHAAGRDWHLRAHGFWQGHHAAADVYAEVVGAWAAAPSGGVAWDLYAGAGLFASVLAGQVGSDGTVLAVESDRKAVADGEANLADLPQVRWRGGKVEHALRDPGPAPDVVVLDPPRKGAGREVVRTIAEGRPDRVIYVACDPAALARDVATFSDYDYELADLRAFDAFPMTHHVECVALLR